MEMIGSHKWNGRILSFNIRDIIIKKLNKLSIKYKLFIIIKQIII